MGYDKLLFREPSTIYLPAWYQQTRFACLFIVASRIFSHTILIICNQFLFKIRITMQRFVHKISLNSQEKE
jgi:hypothetical protein